MTTPATVLVTGASGKTGRRIVHQLTERGHSVIAASRSAQGDHGVQFDWLDHTTYDNVLTENINSACYWHHQVFLICFRLCGPLLIV